MAVATRYGRRRRFMSGIASRLNAHYQERQHKSASGASVPYRRVSDLDLDAAVGAPAGTHGGVRVWRTVVLHDTAANPAREFVPSPRRAEMWTLHGQTHSTRSDQHFASRRVGLDALRGHLLVEVELDGLSPDTKSGITTTGRNTRAQRQIGAQLQDAVDQLLAEDEQLRHWNEQVRERAFQRAARHRIPGLERALRAFGMTFKRRRTVAVVDGGDETDESRRRERPVLEPLEPLAPLHEHPTDVFGFRKVLRRTIRVKRGHTASVLLEADAVDGYFDDPSRLRLRFAPDAGDRLRIVSRDSLEGGRMRIRMRAAADAPLGALELCADCITPERPLADEIAVEVVEPTPPPSDGAHARRRTQEVEEDAPPPVTVHFKDAEDPERRWPEGWTEETVGDFDPAGIARVNGDFAELVRLRNQLPANRHEDVTNVYIAPIAMTLVGLADAEREAPADEEGQEVGLHPHFRAAALRAAALSSIFAIRYMNSGSGLFAQPADVEE